MASDGRTRFSMPALSPGVRLNDTYEIDAHVAAGGMGEVYRGHNIETGEPVAIKTMLPELARDESVFALFKKEATLLGRLRHDTIVHYYSFSRDPASGIPYLAMEFVEGQALADRIAGGPLGGRETATLFMRLAEGLAVAHEAGIIHRDLSPDNIILRAGDVRHPRIIDFGIARSVRAGEGTLIGSSFAGKFNFVSPEQLGMGSGEVTNRSDIYSLALVMAAALRGAPLDMGGTHVAVIEKRRSIPDLTGVDMALLPLLQRMLAPDPADRPADMTEVADWLDDHLAGRPPTVRPMTADQAATILFSEQKFESPFGAAPAVPAPSEPTPPPRRRSIVALVAGTLVLLACVGVGATYVAGLLAKGGEQVAATQPAEAPTGESKAPARVGEAAPPEVAATDAMKAAPEQDAGETVQPPASQPQPTAESNAPASVTESAQQPAPDAGDAAEEKVATAAAPDQMAAAPEPEQSAQPAPAEPTAAEPQTEKGEVVGETPKEPIGEAASTSQSSPAEPKPAAPQIEQPTDTAAATTDAAPPDTAAAPKPGTEAALPQAAVPAAGSSPATVEEKPAEVAAADPAAASPQDTAPETVAPPAAAGIPGVASLEGDCFFARIASVADDTMTVHGMAGSQDKFDTVAKTVTDAGGKAPAIDGPLVSPAQCALVDFMDVVNPYATDDARLTLSSAATQPGETLTASVAGAAGRPVRLLAVNGEGEVRLVGATSKSDAEGNANVAVPVDPAVFKGEATQLVLALVGDMPIGSPEGTAATYFPQLADALVRSTEPFSIDFAHFRLAPPAPAAVAKPTFEPVAYAVGSIRPSHIDQAELDRSLVDFYGEWKKLYLVPECGEGRYVVKINADGKAEDNGDGQKPITSSEAHGYGMLATALMAAADPDAQAVFDGLYRFRADHPAGSSPHLMAWSVVEGCKTAGEDVGGENTATDGDLDIAYSLLLADKAWGSAGEIDYRRAALDTIAAILENEVADKGDYLLLGDWAPTSDEKRFRTASRTSDYKLAQLKAFADASGEQRWLAVRDQAYGVIDTLTKKFSPKTALLPNYVVDVAKSPKPAPAGFMDGDNDGAFTWNAVHYPWRVGLDYLLYGEKRARPPLVELSRWLKGKVKGNPAGIADGYSLNGKAVAGSDAGSLTFVSLFGVAAMADQENQDWLNAIWKYIADQGIDEDDFYGNTLKLMSMIAMSGHWAKL